MEKVFDSVKQITEACNELIKEGKTSECLDVQSLTKTLEDECAKLNELFDKDPTATGVLNVAKVEVERIAIRLEFYLRVRMELFVDRNKMREFAEKLYLDCKQITLELSKDDKCSKRSLGEWGTRTKWCLNFYARSKHLNFVIDNEDELNIKTITIEMKKLKG